MRDFCKPLIPLNGCKGTKFLPFLQVFSAFYCNFHKKNSISAIPKRRLIFYNPQKPNTSPKRPQTLCLCGFQMVRCSPNTSPHISPDTPPSGWYVTAHKKHT